MRREPAAQVDWEAGDGGRGGGGGGARRRRGPRAEETSERTRIQGWPCGGGVGEGDWIRGNTTYKSKNILALTQSS